MKLDEIHTEKVAKPKNMMFLKLKKTKKTNNDIYSRLCGTREHEEVKVRKRKQHQTFLDNVS